MPDTAKQLLAKIKLDQEDFNEQVKKIRASLKELANDQKEDGRKQMVQLQEQSEAIRANVRKAKEAAQEEADFNKALRQKETEQRRAAEALKQKEILQAQEAFERRKVYLAEEGAAVSKQLEKELISRAEYEKTVRILQMSRFGAEQEFIKARTTAVIKSYEVEKDEIKRTALADKARMEESIAMLKIRQRQSQMGAAPIGGAVKAEEGLLAGAGRGLLGGGVGGMFGAVLGGTIVGQMVYGQIERFIGKIKETGEEAAKEAQLFETLVVSMKGNREGAETLIQKLSGATMGLVENSKLIELAAVTFRNNTKMTNEALIQLAKDSMKLGVSIHGPQGASQAFHALMSAMQSGRAYALAHALGLTRAELMQRHYTKGLSDTERAQQLWVHMLDVIHQKADRLPEPMMTVSLALAQHEVATRNLWVELTKVVETTPSLIAVIQGFNRAFADMAGYIRKHWDEVAKIVNDMVIVFLAAGKGLVGLVQILLPIVGRLPERKWSRVLKRMLRRGILPSRLWRIYERIWLVVSPAFRPSLLRLSGELLRGLTVWEMRRNRRVRLW
jgi:hypothetical protein